MCLVNYSESRLNFLRLHHSLPLTYHKLTLYSVATGATESSAVRLSELTNLLEDSWLSADTEGDLGPKLNHLLATVRFGLLQKVKEHHFWRHNWSISASSDDVSLIFCIPPTLSLFSSTHFLPLVLLHPSLHPLISSLPIFFNLHSPSTLHA